MRFILLFCSFSFINHIHAQLLPPQRDSLLVMRAFGRVLKVNTAPLATRIMTVAEGLLGTPYQAGTLEGNPTERLVVNLRQLDCWTFVENCAVIATLTDVSPAQAYRTYQQRLTAWRYRNGKVRGYGSRLHYFSEWVLSAAARGYLVDITATLPHAQPYDKAITFMTDNPRLYPALAPDSVRQTIQTVQRWLSVQPRHYVPKKFVQELYNHLQEGDLLVLTSQHPNLDVEHQGFATKYKGQWHLLHASSVGHKVLISSEPLATYIRRVPAMSGIVVARWKN